MPLLKNRKGTFLKTMEIVHRLVVARVWGGEKRKEGMIKWDTRLFRICDSVMV